MRIDALFALPPHRLSGAKLEAQKVERNDRKVAPPVRILAVDDLRLPGMQHQFAIPHKNEKTFGAKQILRSSQACRAPQICCKAVA